VNEFTGVIAGDPRASRFLFCRVAGKRARQLCHHPSMLSAFVKAAMVAMEETERGLVEYSLNGMHPGDTGTADDDLSPGILREIGLAADLIRRNRRAGDIEGRPLPS
jgi:DNA-directed RNA polymerase subunit K/omega